ncbi:uncharacterized protein LOC130505894 [Raphanus sativus]|uniref:Uncharacterized protein LOC130500191 n=1 Tax=Raphanus sativus TaxID=3726 RepID=A0A9W3CHI9_RAPSA|nr:uncharacterized protein LOC130500191 [Raphanus sativus]XP_056850926.1 uncharacterized protein LOC130500193 [Raphanus sativus]XP_056856477.1 uncharacterized protein LOC130505894 [Raphanus sativus]
MDSRNQCNQYSGYVNLLSSQEQNVGEGNFPYESFPSTVSFGASQIPLFSSQQSEAPSQPDDIVVERRERRKWTPFDDEDAVGRTGLSPLQKCTAAIRQLAYGSGADVVDEYYRLAETTARKCLHQFTAGIIHLFGDQYLRRPTPEDLERLLHVGEERGFPGMVGSIDCMHWEWKNCPGAWKGMYSRGTEKPTIVLEAVASYDLWICHAFFGAPGTMNDINILDRSPVFDDIINGIAPQVTFYVNGTEYNLAYYLTDGIYPKWATLFQYVRLPQGPKKGYMPKNKNLCEKMLSVHLASCKLDSPLLKILLTYGIKKK